MIVEMIKLIAFVEAVFEDRRREGCRCLAGSKGDYLIGHAQVGRPRKAGRGGVNPRTVTVTVWLEGADSVRVCVSEPALSETSLLQFGAAKRTSGTSRLVIVENVASKIACIGVREVDLGASRRDDGELIELIAFIEAVFEDRRREGCSCLAGSEGDYLIGHPQVGGPRKTGRGGVKSPHRHRHGLAGGSR